MAQRIKFTKGKLDAIPVPAEGRTIVYDSDVPKLAVRITPANTRTFYVVKRDGAAMSWVKLGTHPDMTPEQARKAAERVLGDFARGVNPAERKRAERQQQTLGEAFEQYRRLHVTPRGIKSAADIASMWQRFLGPLPDEPAKKHGRKRTKHPAGVDWSRRKLDAIDNAAVRALHAKIGETHRTMANRVVELLSSIYNRASEWGYRGDNPCAGIEPFRETKRDRFIRAEELPRFFAALNSDTSANFRDFVLLCLLTGARRTNVLAMRWDDMDLKAATWRIPQTKNDEPVTVPLVPEALRVLRARKPQATGYVFSADSAVGYMTPPKKRWRALLARAQLQNLRVHDLRRSLGSWQAILGASLPVVGKSLGHKSADATLVYARLSIEPVRASVNAATSAMLAAARVKPTAQVRKINDRRRAVKRSAA
ncbi:MAG: tyrosine-type recombinase/integrase [Rhodospirillaceae bacterium]